MRGIRSTCRALVAVLLLVAGCAESDGGSVDAIFPSVAALAETDSDSYTAGDTGVATFRNLGRQPLYLPGCAPFVFERSLDGAWTFDGPPFVCVQEGNAVAVARNEIDEIEFMIPNNSGIYRLRYDYGSGCEPDLPLSQANCEDEFVDYSNEFEVEREICEAGEFSCPRSRAPVHSCADGVNISGPAGVCTEDPASGECTEEFLRCP